MNKLHQYKIADNIFKQTLNIYQGKNHGLLFFLDLSGSMKDHLEPTIEQLILLIYFCQQIQIPFEVYGFTTGEKELANEIISKGKIIDCGFVFGSEKKMANNFDPILLHLVSSTSPKTIAAQINALFAIAFVSTYSFYGSSYLPILGATPLSQTIFSAITLVKDFKENNNLEIVNTIFLTDGDCSHRVTVQPPASFTKHLSDFARVHLFNRKMGISLALSRDEIIYSERAMIKLFRTITHSNIINFFITDNKYQFDKFKPLASSLSEKKQNPNIVSYTNNDYWTAMYYILIEKCKAKFEIDKNLINSKLIMDKKTANAKHRQISKLFYESNKSSLNANAILNKFVELISV